MARYMNKKNGRIGEVIEEDLKYKTVVIQYEDDESTQNVSTSTLKRWWQLVDDEEEDIEDDEYADDDEYVTDEDDDEEYDEEDEEESEDEEEYEDDEDEDEDLAGDGTPLKEVGKEIAAQAKKKAEKASKVVQERKPRVKLDFSKQLKEISTMGKKAGFEIRLYDKTPNMFIGALEGKGRVEVLFTRKGIAINMKEDMVPKGMDYSMYNNYYLPAHVLLDADDKKLVDKFQKVFDTIVKAAGTAKTKKEVK